MARLEGNRFCLEFFDRSATGALNRFLQLFMRYVLQCRLFFVLLFLPASTSRAQILITEIMYHPVEEPAANADGTPVMDLYDDVHEFIELHNSGTAAVSLAGWELTGGVNFVFPVGAVITPGAYIVVA